MKYSIVIPAYREAEIISESLDKVAKFLNDSGLMDETEIIVVAADGGDDTARIAGGLSKNFKKLVVVEPGTKVGKGRDVAAGMKVASGDFVLFTDADLATPIHHVSETWKLLAAGNDVVIGSRDLIKIHKGYRILVSLGANWLTRLVVLPGIPDTQCGFKAFTKSAAATCFEDLETMGWGFDFELLVKARQAGLKIAKVKILDWHDPKIDGGLVGESGLTATTNTLKELFRVRKKFGRGKESW